MASAVPAIDPSRENLSAMQDSGFDPTESSVAGLHLVGVVTPTFAHGATNDEPTTASGGGAASGAAIVQGAAALWRAVDLDLSPIIGRRGTAALFQRALFLTWRTHDWMPEQSGEASFDACLEALTKTLAGRQPEEAVAARRALESTFHDLLSSLVGAALTTQLLRAAWAHRAAEEAR